MLPCPLPTTCHYLEGLTESAWEDLKNQGLTKEDSQMEVYQRIYHGGVDQPLRYGFVHQSIRIIPDSWTLIKCFCVIGERYGNTYSDILTGLTQWRIYRRRKGMTFSHFAY